MARAVNLDPPASRLAANAQLDSVRLVDLKCDISDDLAPGMLYVNTSLDLAHRYKSGQLQVRSEYILTAESPESGPAWTVRMSWLAEFAFSGEHSEADIEEFATSTGARVIHPFARELMLTRTGRMGYPPLTLPLLLTPSDGPEDDSPEQVESAD